MNTTDAGRLGESKVVAHFTEMGWYPFIDLSGKCPVDLLVLDGSKVYRVQVKSTAYDAGGKKWLCQIKTVRPNRSGNTVKGFDKTSCDILAVYIIPEDRVVLFNADEITQKSAIAIEKLV